jgi:hypothetical protein
VEIWTDVPGMFSANPRQVPQARLLSRLDYEEAQEIATTGAKVLHPRCVSPCRDARVPLWIRDTEHPDLAGTTIDAVADAAPGVKAVSLAPRHRAGIDGIDRHVAAGRLPGRCVRALQAPRPVGRPDRLRGGQCHGVARSQRQPGHHQRARRACAPTWSRSAG